MPDAFTVAHRASAARNQVPAVYSGPVFVINGGLLSYAVGRIDGFRRAATYVDRILRGEKPGERKQTLTGLGRVHRMLPNAIHFVRRP
jgi:putative ABC transport system substrate-binding protein